MTNQTDNLKEIRITQHSPLCKINIRCAVNHPDGICPGPYGKCDCTPNPMAGTHNLKEKTCCAYGHLGKLHICLKPEKPDNLKQCCENCDDRGEPGYIDCNNCICHLPTPEKPDSLKPEGLEDLIKQFNIDYLSEYRWKRDRINNLCAEDWLIINIEKLLSQTKEETERELREKIEGMKIEKINAQFGTTRMEGYNQALEDMLKLIK